MPNAIEKDEAITPIEKLIESYKVDDSSVDAKKALLEAANASTSEDAVESNDVPPHLQKKKKRWQRAVSTFNALADASNIGIVISMISKAWPAIMTVGGGILGSISWMTDGLIYTFRSLSEATRIIGKKFFGMNQENNCPFEEEKNGVHPIQTPLQLLSTGLYAVAVALMFGAIIASPVGIALGWGLALTGLSIATYLNYVRPANLAKEKYTQLKEDPNANPNEVKAAEDDYHEKQKAKLVFVGILLGVAALMLCGTIAVFAPPALVPALLIISKLASAYLVVLNSYRVYDGNREFFDRVFESMKSSLVGLYNNVKSLFTHDNSMTEENTVSVTPESTTVAASTNSHAVIQSLMSEQPVAGNEYNTSFEVVKESDDLSHAIHVENAVTESGRITPISELIAMSPEPQADSQTSSPLFRL